MLLHAALVTVLSLHLASPLPPPISDLPLASSSLSNEGISSSSVATLSSQPVKRSANEEDDEASIDALPIHDDAFSRPGRETERSGDDARVGRSSGFIRFGRGSTNFMRYGRLTGEDEELLGQPEDEDVDAWKTRDSRSDSNFIRFGRDHGRNFIRLGRPDPSLSFGRGKLADRNFIRLGRAGLDDMCTRKMALRSSNFIRFGRDENRGKRDTGEDEGIFLDPNFIAMLKEGKRSKNNGNSNFIRFGRSGSRRKRNVEDFNELGLHLGNVPGYLLDPQLTVLPPPFLGGEENEKRANHGSNFLRFG